ncbi:MAG TPA: type III secretion system export apparatus subunit SctT [Dyella sp.]|uniref:type III secretion system export apparatus subunit SctT n=1 Tax=Dyella sp. TaxID=1869338 RepID=UPI002F95B03F
MLLSPLDRELIALVHEHGQRAAIATVRIASCFAWLPYLSSGTVSSRLTRTVLAMIVLVGMWPVTEGMIVPVDMFDAVRLAGMEALIGTGLGLVLSFPYHAFHALGAMSDNQRGASISSAVDPLSGIEATETANLLQLFSATLFLSLGGMTALLEAVYESYRWLPIGAAFQFDADGLTLHMGHLLAAAVRMAAPLLLLLMLAEVCLGMLSRFAQQLNAFSESLAIKSMVAFLALAIYLMPLMQRELPALWRSLPADYLRPVSELP